MLGAVLLLASCSSTKTQLPYFEDLKTQSGELPEMSYVPEIRPADELFINVSSTQPLATKAYNLPLVNPALSDQITNTVSPRSQTYIVDSKGNINFPVLGSIHVAGLTTEQLAEELTRQISKDVKDPLVTVQLVNFTVIVGGEVENPMTVTVNNPRITILEALSAAGDLTVYGQRDDILVIREENGKRVYGHINLNSSEALTSPYYYLQPNDYIYVTPNDIRIANSKYNQNNAFKLSVISTIVSAASVIASLVIALTVK